MTHLKRTMSFAPSLVPGSYKYNAGLEDGSSELLRDELFIVWTSTNTLVVGGSVYFSDSDSRVAPNTAGKHRRVSQFTEIYLQVQIGSFV
jgi:hypothetical protein